MRTNLLIIGFITLSFACLQVSRADEKEAEEKNTGVQAGHHPGLHGSVKVEDGKKHREETRVEEEAQLKKEIPPEPIGEPRPLNTPMQEALLDTADEKPVAEDAPTQTLKESPRLQGGVKRSTLYAKVRRQKMTAEDFRRLNYGVLGLVAVNRVVVPSLPVVTEVFPTCPAATAGILPGDVLVSEDSYRYRPGAGQKEVWATLGGKAGTKVALTVRRRQQLLTFDLVRMNIEDIPDNHIRQAFESILRQYGPPGSARPNDY